MVNDTCNMDVVPVLHSHVIVEISSQTVLSQRSLLLTLRLSHYWKAMFLSRLWSGLLNTNSICKSLKSPSAFGLRSTSSITFLNFELSENHKPICYNIRMRNINCNIHSWCPMGWSKKSSIFKTFFHPTHVGKKINCIIIMSMKL